METPASKEIYRLISLKLIGAASDADIAALNMMLKENPEFQCLFDEMQKPAVVTHYNTDVIAQAYLAHSSRKQLQQHETHREQVSQNSNFHRRFSRRKTARWVVLTSVLCVLTLAVSLWLTIGNNENKMVSEVSTKKGSKSKVALPDGSVVWLNSESKIHYEENYINHTREVNLIGEAFFDVKHDEHKPFIIHTGNVNIRVLGTAFNVSNYAADKTIQTTLLRGKIELSLSSRADEKIIMKPMDKVTVTKPQLAGGSGSAVLSKQDIADNEKITLTNASLSPVDGQVAETSWIDDKMTFVNEPLKAIAAVLEKKYSVKFVFKNPKTEKYRYTGDFSNLSLAKILKTLNTIKPINYKLSDSTVTIY